eukprot:TRINITY_DN1933_c0_g1_i1.p1 TRINITY_DN1933_c0_g1~~TRINITY_DN1933_c0_g1_i1.p1  ORF type:complete len:592 (-),score=130.82 TRINITY_DN1933_c0_g1_i1:177-1952(-)
MKGFLLVLGLASLVSFVDSSSSERESFGHFDTDGFLDFDDERPSVVVKTSRVTSSSSSVSTSLRRSLVGRGGGSRALESSTTTQRPTTPMATILKQINEHNEDGSYTYGYEASDGSFKLETRYPDGRVQGKYGYVDINGEQKVIEYGADMLGFQPQGDLPEGIIVPPPVLEGEERSEVRPSEAQAREPITDYDYDYSGAGEDGSRSRFVVKNRARTSSSFRAAPQAPISTPTRGREASLRETLESQPKIHFTDSNPRDRSRPPLPSTPTAAPIQEPTTTTPVPFAPTPRHESIRFTTPEPLIASTPRTTSETLSIVEVPQTPRKVRIHHASRLTTTPPPPTPSQRPSRGPSRSRRPPPSSGSPDPLEALKAFMLSNGPFINFGSPRQHTHRRLRPPHRSRSEPRSLPSNKSSSGKSRSLPSRQPPPPPPPSRTPSQPPSRSTARPERPSKSRFSSFPARSNNKGRNTHGNSVSGSTAPPPLPQKPTPAPTSSPSSLKLPPAFQEARRPIRILTSAIPGASINRIPSVTEKPKPGEIVPTDVDFDALIQEFTGQRRRQEGALPSSPGGRGAFPHFSQRTSGPSSLELFADFS